MALRARTHSATPLSARCLVKQREFALLAAKRRAPLPIQDINFSLKTTSGASLDMYAATATRVQRSRVSLCRSTISQNKAAKDSAREQIRRLQEQLSGLMANLSSPDA